MVTKTEVLEAEWKLLRIEISEHGDENGVAAFDGYSRFWCKKAVLGAYWIAEQIDENRVRLHLTDDIELEGFRQPLSFVPDTDFKRELLQQCDWDLVIRQIFPEEPEKDERQLTLFEEPED